MKNNATPEETRGVTAMDEDSVVGDSDRVSEETAKVAGTAINHTDATRYLGDSDYCSLATETEQQHMGVQELVEDWLTQGKDLTLPIHHYEPPRQQANNVQPQCECPVPKRKPEGLGNFITRYIKNLVEAMETAIVDSGATGNFSKEDVGTPTGEKSSKTVGMPNGQPIRARRKMMLPLPQLKEEARLSDELPQLHSNLVSVPTLANNGYISIFKPYNEGLEIYKAQDVKITAVGEPVLRGWRD